MWPQNKGSKNRFRSTNETSTEQWLCMRIILQWHCKDGANMDMKWETQDIFALNSSVGMRGLSELGYAESLLAYFCIWSNRRKQNTSSWDKVIWNIKKWRIVFIILGQGTISQKRRLHLHHYKSKKLTIEENLKTIQLTRSGGGKSATQA